MALDKTAFPEPPNIEFLMATLLYLMSRHAQSPDASISQSVIDHLGMLESHTDCNSAELNKAATRLQKHWLTVLRAQLYAKHGNKIHPEVSNLADVH